MATPKLTTSTFIEKATSIHGDKYDYLNIDIKSSREYIDICCPIHGVFTQRVSAHLQGQGCKNCRNELVRNRFKHSKEDFIKKANLIHNNKYNYDKFNYVSDKVKGIIYCPIHNVEFFQTPGNHKKSSGGCPECAKETFIRKKKNSLEKIINLSIDKHGIGTYDYSLIPEDSHSHDKVKIKCNTCGNIFEQLLYSHCNIGNGCSICTTSRHERRLGEDLKNLNIDIIRNDRTILDGKEIDIFIPSKNIGIEIHGNYWHSELNDKSNKNAHINKLFQAEGKDISLIQFFEDEIVNKYDICLSIVKNKLGYSNNRVFARKCIIKEVSVKDKNEFLDNNHIQGKDQSKVKLGLYYNNELISLMTFASPRYNKDVDWELTRFCNKKDYLVIGAASKLFKFFIINYNPKKIISYADKRISKGGIYDTLGFEYVWRALPRYYYMNKNNYLIRYHRSNFTKNRIKKLYPEVDIENNDEWSIMQKLGYDRIWDCGNSVHIWTNK